MPLLSIGRLGDEAGMGYCRPKAEGRDIPGIEQGGERIKQMVIVTHSDHTKASIVCSVGCALTLPVKNQSQFRLTFSVPARGVRRVDSVDAAKGLPLDVSNASQRGPTNESHPQGPGAPEA